MGRICGSSWLGAGGERILDLMGRKMGHIPRLDCRILDLMGRKMGHIPRLDCRESFQVEAE
jgi:hypothetical protein